MSHYIITDTKTGEIVRELSRLPRLVHNAPPNMRQVEHDLWIACLLAGLVVGLVFPVLK